VFGAAYTLWMYKRVIFGAVTSDKVGVLTDVGSREVVFLSLLALAVLVMGLWPYPFLDVMHASVDNLLQQTAVTKL
jgi:NADH-quinone oxidoreductase subunit M